MMDDAQAIPVECTFTADGQVQVRRVKMEGRWHAVGQGRQWQDADGRHVLIMLPADEVQELLLRADSLTWVVRPLGGQTLA